MGVANSNEQSGVRALLAVRQRPILKFFIAPHPPRCPSNRVNPKPFFWADVPARCATCGRGSVEPRFRS